MAKICDRSPCDSLLNALGKFIFGAPDRDDGGFYMTVVLDGTPTEATIDYCPYCGTRLEEVPTGIVNKFMRPRKRKRFNS